MEQVLELKHREFTQKALAIILQKKLFNLQCLWRAEQITLPGIRITFDFWYWSVNIFNCPYIDPVTETELDVLQKYIQTDDFNPEHIYTANYGWQYYYEVMRQRDSQEHDEILSWYDFYDLYMGTGAVSLLPDIRGQKEKMYCEAVKKKEAEDKAAAGIAPIRYTPVEHKEYLFPSVHRYYEVATLHDDPYFIALLKAQSEEEAAGDELENNECDAISYFYKLENIANLPPVRAGVSWRMALKYCFIDYLKAFIASDLPAVCEEYHLYRSMNLVYKLDNRHDKEEKSLEEFILSNKTIEDILQGRVLLGEPGDLNF